MLPPDGRRTMPIDLPGVRYQLLNAQQLAPGHAGDVTICLLYTSITDTFTLEDSLAIEEFQRTRGLTVTGVIDEDTWTLLYYCLLYTSRCV